MSKKVFPKSQLPIRKTIDFLPKVFQTDTNDKFLSGVFDPLIQPGVLEKTVGYIGKRYGKTFNGTDVYLDTDDTLRSRYQLEPAVVIKKDNKSTNFYDYIDFKNILNFFGNHDHRDDLITAQEHYSWNPPIDWDKFVNYREYYWVPGGPPSIPLYGNSVGIISTYKVKLGDQSTYIFSPDGYSNNPTLTLYRGQTYKFVVNVPGQGFVFRTSYDTGSLLFNPNLYYPAGSLVVFEDKLWRSKVAVGPEDGSTITADSQDWEFVETTSNAVSLDYNKGVTNAGIESGTITFEVPFNAPDLLYYQSIVDPNRFGKIIISDIEASSKIDVDKEVIGKITYTSSNGVTLSNGMIVTFEGQVTPSKYASSKWLVEGVGKSISLTDFEKLVVPVLSLDIPEVMFDNEGFDANPFDDASAYPGTKDYITISKSSLDANPWSRYNRWFHRSVLEYSSKLSGADFSADETRRAKRPIIEFLPNLKLFKHGSVAKETVDYIDNYTDDVFSKIEGSQGYIVDGENLFEGARILVVADKDSLANNRIYQVNFIEHNGVKQITLRQVPDTESTVGETVLIRRGNKNQGLMYYFDGTSWNQSQQKTKVNQAPLFDVFDANEVSFADFSTYPVSTFTGSKLLSYKEGTGIVDTELGFKISYLNIDNVGDIQFNFDWDTDSFTYEIDKFPEEVKIYTGAVKFTDTGLYSNLWTTLDNKYAQPIIDSVIITESTNTVTLTAVNWNEFDADPLAEIHFYVNGVKTNLNYTRSSNAFTFDHTFKSKDVLSVKIFFDGIPNTGYYEIPLGLEKNPLNEEIKSFTLGQAVDHVHTGLEFYKDFSGTIPGNGNLRDIDGYQVYSKRFLKHESLVPVAITTLVDKKINIIKSIRYAKKSYTEFKNNFLKLAETLDFDGNIPVFVDTILAELTKTKVATSPFVDSDMIGSGAYSSIDIEVEDPGINTFALSQQFNLSGLSRRAVYLYLNGHQLIHGVDYEFNDSFPFVTVSKTLTEGDSLQIREYSSTAFNHIPPTPTKMGVYKKYMPMKFVDDTYVTPKEVIQGHDGSIISSFGDYRDNALLELEFRIYNNIKQTYDESIFDIDKAIGGYYKSGLFDKSYFDHIVSYEFLRWISDTNVDYVNNVYFDSEDSFTYTYSNMSDPTRTQSLPGWWRGVFRWFFDTDRPHRCPWEMLGFSEQPSWWEDEYGPAPYTSGNLILWEDLEAGIIRKGSRAGTHERYKRPGLTEYIPVDGDGKLLSPLDCNLAKDFVLINNQGTFKLGDIAPAEHTWRSTSEYPFAVIIAMCLLKPFEFIGVNFDRSRTTKNNLNQTNHTGTSTFVKVSDYTIPEIGGIQTAGIASYIVDYLLGQNIPTTELSYILESVTVSLTHRLSGFVDQNQQRFVLDSKSPKSTSSTIFIPPENQEIFFNVSAPIRELVYSAVILEKTDRGWKVAGYDNQEPYFEYYEPIPSQNDALISVGGVSEGFLNWAENKLYGNGVVVRYQNEYYRSLKSHTSTSIFDNSVWKKLPGLPKKNAVEAFNRTNFNYLKVSQVSYGTILTSIQSVVDLLLGYEQFLKANGFVFENYDSENQVVQDWTTSVKEFMYWTQHNWAIGSLITLSPGAEKLECNFDIGVPDNLLDSFYDYQVYRSDGNPLIPNFLNIKRDFQSVTIETTNTSDGIYFFKGYLVLKEHVAIFNDRTVFNDVIYDRPTGYRQERMKSRGFRTVDWDGDYTSPGFLFDNVNIQVWQPFVDYNLGDIVSYRTYNWVSLTNHQSGETFDTDLWSRLDSTPSKSLVPNFDYRINQFDDYYNLDADGLLTSQRELGRHAIGYQSREYLQNLAEDSVTQFQLYQGFIRDKGTINAASKIFDKLSRTSTDSIVLNEEWAFNVGTLGGQDQVKEIEFNLSKDKFEINPQPIIAVSSNVQTAVLDQYLRITPNDFNKSANPFTTDIIYKTSSDVEQVAGYVKLDQVDFVVKTRDDILNIDITSMVENDHIWVTFDSISWTVLRFNRKPLLLISNISKEGEAATVTFTQPHNFNVGDIIGFTEIKDIQGFYKITEVTLRSVTFTIDTSLNPLLTTSTPGIYGFVEARFNNFNLLDPEFSAALPNNSKLWVDNNGQGKWSVVTKKKVFNYKKIANFGTTVPANAGSCVVYIDNLRQTVTSMPSKNLVMVYVEDSVGLQIKQSIFPDTDLFPFLGKSFGHSIAVSPDNKWMAIGSPLASYVPTSYVGEYDPSRSYVEGDIVLYAGKLWKSLIDTVGDGSSLNVSTENWEVVSSIPYNPNTGNGKGEKDQGLVHMYEWSNQFWIWRGSFASPRQASGELFGSNISIGKTDSNYWMTVSAPGALDNRGRVYIFKHNGSTWNFNENKNYLGVYAPTGEYHPTTGRYYSEEEYTRVDNLVAGLRYVITEVGNTNWNLVAGTTGMVYSKGSVFVAATQGTGTGTVDYITYYPKDSIVWFDGFFWKALVDNYGDESTLTIDSSVWMKIDNISTQASLPTNVALEDDGSTLASGILSTNDLAELTKQGDDFGFSIATSQDASILVIGAPNADGLYFPNYKGLWNSYTEYTEGDVVKYKDPASIDATWSYHKLVDPRDHSENWDSSVLYTSIAEAPVGSPWENIGDSTVYSSGKVYIYRRDANDVYNLTQTITSGSLADINDSGDIGVNIARGDNFGYSVDIDSTGRHIVISSPMADVNLQNQGAVYYFVYNDTLLQWRLKQKLESADNYTNILFGSSVSISNGIERIAVGAKNAPYRAYAYFNDKTTFDKGATNFSEFQGYAGQVYSFERLDSKYILTEKLEADVGIAESFGSSVDATSSVIVVGSPYYVDPISGVVTGQVRTFRKDPSVKSFNTIAFQEDVVDFSKIKNISLIDTDKLVKIQDIDYIDPAKLKILSLAEQEIKFKTPYDPAVYTLGTDEQVVDEGSAWFEKQVGKLWWNTSTAKWIYYEQGDVAYRTGNWSKLAEGASIDVYEWVETALLPSEWSALADTADGLTNNISGQPLHPNDDVYSVKQFYNPITQQVTETYYYYWVKSSTVVPTDSGDRRISAAVVADMIENPASQGIPIVALIDSNSVLAYNFTSVLSSDNAALNIEFYKVDSNVNPIHREFILLSEGVADSLPNDSLEAKWIDSLVGFDKVGNTVPDISLPEREKYGLSFRPRQSMFKDRQKVMSIVIDNINSILTTKPFADTIDFENLNAVDPQPSIELNEYDIELDTYTELQELGSIRVRPAVLKANIVNGEVDTIDIIDSGIGYKRVPYITIQGSGQGATASITLDRQGKVSSVTVLTRGKKYDSATITIRPYSVLVKNDETIKNYWAIYSWDSDRSLFYRRKAQGYDTTKYWTLIDWWKEGYGEKSRLVTEIENLYLEPTLDLLVGDIIKVKEYGNGGWAVLERVEDGTGEILSNYTLVGRKNGTIKILSSLYNKSTTAIGFDNVGFYDTILYDSEPSTELRYVLKATKENIFVDDLTVEWNKLFFTCVRYVFSEQDRVNWAFKTSFVNATHNIGSLEQKVNYKNDNLPAFQQYLEEVKPYRTTIREYTSKYTNIENTNSEFTDFDLPPAYSTVEDKILPINAEFDLTSQYPWKYWYDNLGYSVVSIEVSNSGSGYTSAPRVVIEGSGSGANAKAYISNGRVTKVIVSESGTGYTSAPTVTLVGGNGTSQDIAKAVAIIGDTKTRTFTVGLKFDRISKTGLYETFERSQSFTADGRNSVFYLNYAPSKDKSKVKVTKNGELVLGNEYSITFYRTPADQYHLLKGKVIFNIAPEAGDTIRVAYDINDELFDSVNRIQKFYAPDANMVGNDLSQLMTGIDFGGVQVQGTTFDVTGGWDALPWFTDSWDSVESNTDHAVVIKEPVQYITLPYVPAQGQLISVYIKRSGENNYVRIDDPALISDGSSVPGLDNYAANPNAVMPSFVGDGSTQSIDIGRYIQTYANDTLIFRTFESDGSLIINDPNLLDTKISGGTLATMSGAYSTATGVTAEEIVIQGGKFDSPEHSTAPEENVPSQVLDSLSIKVYQVSETGSSPLQNNIFTANGIDKIYPIGLDVLESKSVLVYVDKVQMTLGANYSISFADNNVHFNTAPAQDSVIEIIAIGRGGVALLDYQEFIADGKTTLFLTRADYERTQSVFVTVNGAHVDVGYGNSTVIAEETGAVIEPEKTMAMFGIAPKENAVVKIISLGSSLDTDSGQQSLIRVNKQRFEFEGSTRSFELDQFVELTRNSAQSSMVVELTRYPLDPSLGTPATRKLVGPDSYYVVYDGTNNEVAVGYDPDVNVTSVDIRVYINNILQPFVLAYVYDGTVGKVIVNTTYLNIGDIIKIEITNNADYTVDGNVLTIDNDIVLASNNETDNDIIEVTWFSEYPTFDIVSSQHTGGKVYYKLSRTPLDSHYVWVYVNGRRLTNRTDYSVSAQRNSVYLNVESTNSDIVEIIEFGNNIYKDPRAFEIQKDMLNIDHYLRCPITEVTLAKDLYYYDNEIRVTDASNLDEPFPLKRLVGTVLINGEKIEYLYKNGNVLSGLRRGVTGTGIAEIHTVGTKVVNVGYNEIIPYSDTQDRFDFVWDGTSELIGPLEFVPEKTLRSTQLTTSSAEFCECDQIEVFVSGRRLIKDQVEVYDASAGPQGSGAKKTVEPEFTVDGSNPYIRLSSNLRDSIVAGARVLVIRKTGKIWYERGEISASKGITLLDNNTPIARFIDQKPSQLP